MSGSRLGSTDLSPTSLAAARLRQESYRQGKAQEQTLKRRNHAMRRQAATGLMCTHAPKMRPHTPLFHGAGALPALSSNEWMSKMGQLVDGVWHDVWYDTKKSGGAFERNEAQFRPKV